jgi:hypothetical protein
MAGLLFVAASPAAAQGQGEVNLTLQPSDAEVTPGDAQLYDVVVEEPDNGISAYEKVDIEVADPTVANITSFNETAPDGQDGPVSNASIQDGGASLVLDTALLDAKFSAASSVTIANFSVEAVGSRGDSTSLSFNQSAKQDLTDNNNSIYAVTAFNDANFSIPQPPNFQVTIDGTNSPVVKGEDLSVTATINNTGDQGATQTISLGVDTSTTVTSVTLSGGESTQRTLTLDTSSLDTGSNTAQVSSGNDSASTGVTIQEPANFSVSFQGTNSPVVEGNTLTADVLVENTGDVQGTQTVDLSVGALGTDSTSVTLPGGAQTSEALSVGTGSGDAGSYTATVSSANDTASTGVTVDAPATPANFTVAIDSTNSPVVEGDTLTVNATIENTGDQQATQSVALEVFNNTVTLGAQSASVTLAGGASQQETFTIGTGAGDASSYTAEVLSDNDTASTGVTVQEPANFSVSIQSTNSPVVEGQNLSVTATVTNVGDVQGTGIVDLNVVGGVGANSTGVTLASGASTNVTLTVGTTTGDAGSYTVDFFSQDDGDSTSVTVLAPVNFQVSNIQPADATVTNGTLIDVSADIENTGTQQGTQDITLSIDGFSQTTTETLAAGANTTVTFSNVDTGALGPGSYTHTISSANDSASGSLTVEAEGPNQSLVFNDQERGGTGVTVENVQSDGVSSTIIVTYESGSDLVIAGLNGGTFSGENVTVALQNDNGFPNDYTAHILPAADLSQQYQPGDVVSAQTAQNIVDNDTATISPSSGPEPNQSLAFNDQQVDNGAVTVENVQSDGVQSGVIVTYPSGSDDVVAGATAGTFAGENVSISVGDTGGVPGTHTAHILPAADASQQYQAGDTLSQTTRSNILANETATISSATQPEPANFSVTIDATNSPITEGETLTVNATIENTGGQQDTQSVAVDVGALGFASAQSVTLGAGDSTTENYTLATSAGDAGSYTATLSSDNDTDTATVTVEEQTSYGITNVTLDPDTVDSDARVDHTLNYTVTGASDDGNEDTHTVTLPVGANFTNLNTLSIVDANGDPISISSSPVLQSVNGGINNSVTFGIQPDASANTAEVVVEANVTVQFPTVESDTTEDVEINVTDSNRGPASATTPVTILAPTAPANFTVEVIGQSSPVEGGDIQINTEVTNVGDLQGTQTVELSIPELGTDSASVTLNAGENTTESLTIPTSVGDAGVYTATVTTANDTASTSVFVQALANFTVSNIQPADATVTNGTEIDVSADIENVGDIEGTQDITLSIDGFSQTQTETLAGGANTTVTFSNVDTGALGPGSYTHTIASANDSASGNLTVEPEPTAATFLVNNIQPADATVTNGTVIDVSADVENVGDQQGTQDLTLSIDGFSQTQTETLAGGANTTVTFTGVDTGALGPGSYTHEIASANDSATGSLTVQAPANFQVTIDSANSGLTEGEDLIVTATVENTGDAQSTQTVTLDAGALGTNSTQVTLAGGANTTETFSVGTASGDAGTYTATVSSANDSDSQQITVNAPSNFTVSIQSTNSPVVEGDTLTVDAEITNTGDVSDTQTVELSAGALGTNSTQVTLAGGANTTETLSVGTASGEAGTYTATVSSDDDSASTGVTVESAGPQQSLDFNDQNLSDGQNGAVLVENVTTDGVNSAVLVTYANGSDDVVAGVATPPVSDGDINVSIVDTGGFPGDHTAHIIPAEDASQAYQPGDIISAATAANITASETATVSRVAEQANFTVSNLQPADATVTSGTEIDVSADIENVGDRLGTQNITLSIDGLSQTQTETLGAGNTTSVVFSDINTGTLGPGSYTHEIASANDSATGSLTVQAPANFQVTIDGTNSPVTVGDTLSVEATIENTGDEQATQTINLAVGTLGTDSTQVTLAGGANTTETFTVGTASGDAGSYTARVSSEDDSENVNVAVESEPTGATFQVSNLQPADATQTRGLPIDISADIQNVGDQQGTQDITLTINGFSATKSRTLAVGANRTVTFQVDTSVLSSGEYTHTVQTANDSVAGNLTILGPAESSLSGLDIAGQGTSATITEGDQGDLSVNVTNLGDVADSFNVTLAVENPVNDLVVDETQQVNVAGGATETVVFQSITGALAASDYDVSVSTPDDEVTGTLTVEQPPTPALDNLNIANQSAAATVTNGSDRNVSVDVTNVGDQQGTFTVALNITDSADQSAVQQTSSVTLTAGETTTVTFENVTGGLGIDDYNVTISSDAAVTEGTLSVIEQPTEATFLLSDLQPTDALVANGSQIDISANVENVGDLQGTQDITLTVDGVSQTTTETLAAGANTTVTFSGVDTGALGIGEYTHEIATANDTLSSSLTVSEPIFVESYQVSTVRLRLDQTLTVNATVRNIDSQSRTLSVPLTVDGQTVDTAQAQVGADSTATVSLQADDLAFGNASVAVAGLAPTEVTVEGPDLTGNGKPAADTTGDGKLNDVNGDGEYNALDVQALFSALDDNDPALQPNFELFNFQGSNNEVTILDVQRLFTQLPSVDA